MSDIQRTSAMTWQLLYQSMAERWRPEDVASLGAQLHPALSDVLRPASSYAWYGTRTGVFERYGRPGFRGHSVDTSITTRFPGLPTEARAAAAYLRQLTGLTSGDLRHRLPSPLRKSLGVSRRQYMKWCRIQLALERKLERLGERGNFVRWTRIAASGWALDITLEEFMTQPPATRIFIAYYVARRQRQSLFSGNGQDPAYDNVSDRLLQWTTPSVVGAKAFPDAGVLSTLSHDDRTHLLLMAYQELLNMAQCMSALWDQLGANRDKMIVRRGMNSSDWNAVAGAWNAVRAMWVALLYACGRENDLDEFCPGKVMRLMAADVARWHEMLGEDEGPDVKVFKQLPLPWDVVLGRRECSRHDVETACESVSVPAGSWTRPRKVGTPVTTVPTMPLVHGVAVSNPELARILRKAGWFSGDVAHGKVLIDVEVQRDEHGFAQKAVEGVAQR